MVNPAPPGEGVCAICRTFTGRWTTCYQCAHRANLLAAVVPITYSLEGAPMHAVLRGYKDDPCPADRLLLARDVAALLWRFLLVHEACVARAAGVARFDVVTTVPSGCRRRDRRHPLPHLVGDRVAATAGRYRRLLEPSGAPYLRHSVDPGRFTATRSLHGATVLLIDDTWTSGANAQSAAWALRRAGVRVIALVAVGRHLRRHQAHDEQVLRVLKRPFDWTRCAVAAPSCAMRQLPP